MRKGKIQLEGPPEGLIEIHENEDPVRIKIDRKFFLLPIVGYGCVP